MAVSRLEPTEGHLVRFLTVIPLEFSHYTKAEAQLATLKDKLKAKAVQLLKAKAVQLRRQTRLDAVHELNVIDAILAELEK